MRSLFSIVSLSLLVAGCAGARPVNLGVRDGRLAPCPGSPNCVSSQSTGREHGIEPLRYTGSPASAMELVKKVVLNMKRTRIVAEEGLYLHAEFTSALFRFVDDVEFLVDERATAIHIRSASRIGSSDLGVNRKRVENIRAAMASMTPH